MFDPRPLCCSSLTTAVGGTTDTNFVDSAHPTVARIRGSQQNVAWSQSDHVEQKLQLAGLIEPVMVVKVELYSLLYSGSR